MCDGDFFFLFSFFFFTCELHFIPLRLPLSKNMLVKVKSVVLTVRGKGANTQSSVLLNVFVAWRLLRINNSVDWNQTCSACYLQLFFSST